MWYNGTRSCWTFACFILADDFVKLFDESDIRYQQMQYWDDPAGTSRKFWISMKFREWFYGCDAFRRNVTECC